MKTSSKNQTLWHSLTIFLDNSDGYILKKLRTIDIWNVIYRLSSASIAMLVALGEAITAAYFMQLVSLGAIISVAVPAFLVNFFLFNSDTYNFLKSFLQGQLFTDHKRNQFGAKVIDADGNPVSVDFKGWKRWFLRISMAVSLFAGLLCGFMQLNSVLTTFGALIYGLSAVAAISAPPLGLVTIAATISIVSIIANAALLYANLEKFIREREYNNYIDTFKSIFGLQKDKNKQLSLGWQIYHGAFALCGITAAVGIYFISLGLFQAQAFKAFHGFLHLSARLSNILTIFIANIGHLVNGFFYARNIMNLSQLLEDRFKKIAIIALSFNFSKVFHRKKMEENTNHIAITMVLKELILLPVSAAVFIGLLYCCYINGVSQGNGAMTEPRSIAWLTKCLRMPHWLAEKVCFTLMATGSTSANAFACFDGILDILGFFGSTADRINQAGQFVCYKSCDVANNVVHNIVGFARKAYGNLSSSKVNSTDGIENPLSGIGYRI